jgi:hypothetical protein
MPGPGYRRVLSYDEEGRLIRVSRLQNGVTTPLFEYGYGYDGARRWRKDLASNVWDWYPCGVACCAGDLVTLRSTDGGAAWSVLERRLDQAPVVNGEPLLGSLGSGTQRFGAEAALTDAMGVLRGGAYGPGLNSLLNPLRGDAGVEEAMRGLQVPARPVQTPPQLDLGLTRDECFLKWQQKHENCRTLFHGCLAAAGVGAGLAGVCAALCLKPPAVIGCAVCIGVGIATALLVIGCFLHYWHCRRGADRWRDACLRGAAPPAVAPPAIAPPGSTGGDWV